jgi:uncharacterized protein
MKRFSVWLLLWLLCLSLVVPVMAADAMPRLVDGADLLASREEERLLTKLNTISEKYGMDVVIVTTDTLEGKTPSAYADDFYDYNGYADDGVLLLVSMEDNDWWISTTGYGISAFTDAGIEYLGELFVPDLSNGDYAEAFESYADNCDAFIARSKTGDPYDSYNLPKEPFNLFFNLAVCLGIGLLIGVIVTAIMKSQLKSVRSQSGAADYVKTGSMNITQRQDLFLYRDVRRVEKPKSSSGSTTHRSSSGRSHGGGGGKF